MTDDEGGRGLQYWLQWQVAICAVIIAAPLVGSVAVIKRARPEPLRSADMWAPCWKGMHPLWLLAARALALVVMSWLLYEILVLFGPLVFYFYTMWTFALVIIYFAIATLVSAHGCWIYSKQTVYANKEDKGSTRRNMDQKTPATLTSRKSKNQNTIKLKSCNEQVANEKKAGFLGYLMQIVYQICGGAVMQTDIVFWLLLLPFMSNEQFSLTLVIGSMHSVNAVFLLLDTALNKLPFPWFRMAYFILFSCIYVTFHWVLHACGSSWWPYPFLELATPWAPAWYISLALIHILCYGMYYVIVRAKNSYFPNVSSHAHQKAQ